MRKWWSLLALSVFLTAVYPAWGQEETGVNNLRVRMGVFFPQRAETRDTADKAWFTAGVEYPFQPLVSPGFDGKFTLSADFMGNKTMHSIPVQVNLVGTFDRFTWSVGVGMGFAKNVNGEAKSGMSYSVGINATMGNMALPLEVGVVWRGLTNVSNQLDGIGVHLQLRL